MRLILCCYLVLFFQTALSAQTLQAKYVITTTVKAPLPAGGEKQIPLTYSGQLYRKANRYIYFEKPDYLNKYPDGEIVIIEGNNTSTIDLGKDTMQGVCYMDYDSSIIRWRDSYVPGYLSNHVQHFDSSLFAWATKRWQLEDETKEINGLTCRKARIEKQWVAWYCPDIPMQFGISNARGGLPGMIVEADRLADNKHYVLESYTTGGNIDDRIFWPALFNEPFQKEIDFKILPHSNKSNQQQKRLDLLRQSE